MEGMQDVVETLNSRMEHEDGVVYLQYCSTGAAETVQLIFPEIWSSEDSLYFDLDEAIAKMEDISEEEEVLRSLEGFLEALQNTIQLMRMGE